MWKSGDMKRGSEVGSDHDFDDFDDSTIGPAGAHHRRRTVV